MAARRFWRPAHGIVTAALALPPRRRETRRRRSGAEAGGAATERVGGAVGHGEASRPLWRLVHGGADRRSGGDVMVVVAAIVSIPRTQ